jgi:hypothetical protein
MNIVEYCAPDHRTPDWEFATREGEGS